MKKTSAIKKEFFHLQKKKKSCFLLLFHSFLDMKQNKTWTRFSKNEFCDILVTTFHLIHKIKKLNKFTKKRKK